jgi:RNA polymerase primary sigma factor
MPAQLAALHRPNPADGFVCGPAALAQAVKRAKGGDRQACDEVLSVGRRMVVGVARRFGGQGIPVEDLVQEGMVGILRAIHRFDPEIGEHFLAYAAFYVREAISKAVAEQSRPTRIPVSVWKRASRMRATERELAARLGRMPTHEEVSGALGVDSAEVSYIQRALHYGVSFQAPLDEGGSESLAETIADPGSTDALEQLVVAEELAMLPDLLRTVGHRGREILTLRYGLDGEPPLTPSEIADRRGLSRERVRQLEVEAIRRMRHAAGVPADTGRHPAPPTQRRRDVEHKPVTLTLGYGPEFVYRGEAAGPAFAVPAPVTHAQSI